MFRPKDLFSAETSSALVKEVLNQDDDKEAKSGLQFDSMASDKAPVDLMDVEDEERCEVGEDCLHEVSNDVFDYHAESTNFQADASAAAWACEGSFTSSPIRWGGVKPGEAPQASLDVCREGHGTPLNRFNPKLAASYAALGSSGFHRRGSVNSIVALSCSQDGMMPSPSKPPLVPHTSTDTST
mmetsp:Transcript_35834/g.41817  ORF Transcript_35834/g.41817 Transcript_35834/m.41817 type:complete len:184 (+) Transcript_35834:53-604(+)|eukprot:CAMPEP_0176464762 /NCGR_PEP_ID=MMETSP0127-20121128/36757_1 /TAXON_ID=938130 /ORGANISM="Platyophrya macrostoma, Strain WH" /LENGTH=183 /DNA_ID=CAMNT_0017857335 /DNA_START=42 /DNA_END=593 /DNA_ORIENTATION=-